MKLDHSTDIINAVKRVTMGIPSLADESIIEVLANAFCVDLDVDTHLECSITDAASEQSLLMSVTCWAALFSLRYSNHRFDSWMMSVIWRRSLSIWQPLKWSRSFSCEAFPAMMQSLQGISQPACSGCAQLFPDAWVRGQCWLLTYMRICSGSSCTSEQLAQTIHQNCHPK